MKINVEFLAIKAEASNEIHACLQRLLLNHCHNQNVFIHDCNEDMLQSAANTIADICLTAKKGRNDDKME